MRLLLLLLQIGSHVGAIAGSKQSEFELAFDKIKADAVLNDVFDVGSLTNPEEGPNKGQECPPCFNCNLPNFECSQFSQCNPFTGMCECRDGYGGMDCSKPLCGSLSKGNDKRPIRKENQTCECSTGWKGINCNLCDVDSACDPFVPEGLKGTCYKSGILVNKNHQMCDVTNPKIISILKGKKPQATFSCNRTSANCDFQFWIDQKESFYCDLDTCKFSYDLQSNSTHYRCDNVKCKCMSGRMLCGEKGSIDISDFLVETIKGPGDFSCNINSKKCMFSEPSMNDLITSVFGDPYITLSCNSGECIHKSEIPDYVLPPKKSFTIGNISLIGSVGLLLLLAIATSMYNIGKSPLFKKTIDLDANDFEDEITVWNNTNSHSTLSFHDIGYQLPSGKNVLRGVFGYVKPGECLAIMGGSGAGKTTLLDILAGKNKDGDISGEIFINGNAMKSKDYKKLVGFVDQEDNLMSTLTVYETVLNSALLRLPRAMSLRAKQARVIEVLKELRILNIKDRIVGSDFERGISGGEKRRVSIACELVTSPLMLFLDEPTSGLDAYNARNVVDCLVRLAKDYSRTIIFTIHQPRSNIVSLFDKLILLSDGELIYSSDMIKCNDFFYRNGYKCPTGYNIADYLIDITTGEPMTVSSDEDMVASGSALSREVNSDIHSRFVDSNEADDNTSREWEHYAVHREELQHSFGNDKNSSSSNSASAGISEIFKSSFLANETMDVINELKVQKKPVLQKDQFKKASILTQTSILCSRTFKNTYRSPKLLLSHYLLSCFIGCFCGYLYYDVQNDISGFQNRLGLFFFVLALLGFSSLTGLHSFSTERIIFIRERANNYYHPFSYYVSKIVSDLIPLRVLPPVMLISILYPLVGLNMQSNSFVKAILVLVLFNVAISAEILIVSIVLREPGASTMLGVLLLLFSLLFAGLFINSENVASQIQFMEWISLFHYAYEALAINEVKDLILKEKKYGLSIEVPGATILTTFGFNVAAFEKDVLFLIGWGCFFIVLGYICLFYFAIERR